MVAALWYEYALAAAVAFTAAAALTPPSWRMQGLFFAVSFLLSGVVHNKHPHGGGRVRKLSAFATIPQLDLTKQLSWDTGGEASGVGWSPFVHIAENAAIQYYLPGLASPMPTGLPLERELPQVGRDGDIQL